MPPATFTSKDFNREPGRIKRAAKQAPVIITERSRPDIVVMSYDLYASLTGTGGSFLDRIGMPDLSDIELDTSLPKVAPREAVFD
ncbi:MAG: type II toxin-antitoxin system prevent-host-death family antitoxin [Sphingomonas taxi]